MKGFVNFLGIYKIRTFWGKLGLLVLLFLGTIGLLVFFDYYPQIFASNVLPEKTIEIGSSEPIILDFSFSPLQKDFLQEIKISPKEEVVFEWLDSGKKLSIAPKKYWKPESQYQITLPSFLNLMFVTEPEKIIKFATVEYPRVESFYPENNTKDVILDMEDPMVANFNKSTRGFFVNFVLNPERKIIFENNIKKDQFRILPEEGLEAGKSYSMDIYVKLQEEGDNKYKKIYSGKFETLPKAPLSWEKDFSLRLDQAKRFTKARIVTGKYIDVNLEAQVMSLFEDGKVVDSFLISSGKRGMETPKGEHQIYNKTPRAWSKQYGLYMPFWMAIVPDGKVGIHELPEWPGGFKEGANHLGTPVSHGCMRLGIGSAERVYNWSDIGTKVIIY